MTTQRKPNINLYIHTYSVTEQPLDGLDYALVRHGYSHPDCHIQMWRGGMVSIAGKRDAIEHALLTALTANGISALALRDTSAAAKPKERGLTEVEYEGSVAQIRELEARRDMLVQDNPGHKTEHVRKQIQAYNSQLSRLRKKVRDFEQRAKKISLL